MVARPEEPPAEPTICVRCKHCEGGGPDPDHHWCAKALDMRRSFVTGEMVRVPIKGDYVTCSVRNREGKCPDYEEASDAE